MNVIIKAIDYLHALGLFCLAGYGCLPGCSSLFWGLMQLALCHLQTGTSGRPCHPQGIKLGLNTESSALQCEYFGEPQFWIAVIGINNILKPHLKRKEIKIDTIIIHPEFKHITFENDVALVHLKRPVTYNNLVQPICLPVLYGIPKITETTRCFISGWGKRTEGGTLTPSLQEAEVNFISRRTCNAVGSYAGRVPNTSFCAGDNFGNVDSCTGDSGGPLMCYFAEHDKFFLTGITSAGVGCGRAFFPGIYTDVQLYEPWIKKQWYLEDLRGKNEISIVRGKIIIIMAFIVLFVPI